MIAIRHTTLIVLLACATSPAVTYGHFVWVTIAEESSSPRVEIYFSETATPGSAHLVSRIESATAWITQPGVASRKLELAPWRDDQTRVGGLAAELACSGACRVEVDCPYGVFEHDDRAVLLHYYAKAIHGQRPSEIGRLGPAEQLMFDIVPALDGDQLVLTTRFAGEPVADCSLVIETPDATKRELKTDASGRAMLPRWLPGRFAVRAMHTVRRAGSLEGDAYTSELHVATLTINAAPAAEISATDLLEKARGARALWKNFPGFSAKLSVHVDNRRETGTISVSADGDATLNGFDRLADGFVRQQIDSLIMHRLPGSAFDEGASYDEEPGLHVMGRRVRLAEERMGSVYRVRDNVITEVNRTMGKQHFTISVLDVFHNAEGDYLPHVFTVSFWDNNSGALDANHTYLQEWVRVGKYDLPKRVLIVSSDKHGRRVTKLDFSDHALGAPQTAEK